MNELDPKSSSAATPLPKSAAAATRCQGTAPRRARLDSADGTTPWPVPDRWSGRSTKRRLHALIMESGVVTDGHGGGHRPVGRVGGAVLEYRRHHPLVLGGPPDAQRPRPRHLDPVASITVSTSWVVRPGLTSELVRASRTRGTGRSSSRVTLTSCIPSPPGCDSAARVARAATGPPWRPRGDQGPRASSVGTSGAPSGTNWAAPPLRPADPRRHRPGGGRGDHGIDATGPPPGVPPSAASRPRSRPTIGTTQTTVMPAFGPAPARAHRESHGNRHGRDRHRQAGGRRLVVGR